MTKTGWRPPRFVPAVDFTIYGVEPSWPGRRAVDGVACSFRPGSPTDPPYGVWLGHRSEDGLGGLRVGTFRRDAMDRLPDAGAPQGGPLAAVAAVATSALVDITIPGPGARADEPRTPDLIDRLVRHAHSSARHYADWPRENILLSGRTVAAKLWRFAGAWAGFADALPDAYIVVLGVNLDAAGLPIVPLAGTAQYGLDLAAPIDRRQLMVPGMDPPHTIVPRPNPTAYHPEQIQLLLSD